MLLSCPFLQLITYHGLIITHITPHCYIVSDTITTRPLTAADIDWIVGETAASYTAELGLTASEVDNLKTGVRKYLTEDLESWAGDSFVDAGTGRNSSDYPQKRMTRVAMKNDEAVGSLSTWIRALPTEDETKPEWLSTLSGLIVREKHRKQGVATALLKEAEACRVEDGTWPTVTLSVHAEAGRARRLYETEEWQQDGAPMWKTPYGEPRLMYHLKKSLKPKA